MSSHEWRVDALPLGVWGTSGAGKTTFLRFLQFAFRGTSIFFNSDEEPDMGHLVESVDELEDALRSGHDRIDFRIPELKSEDPELYRDVVEFLLLLGNRLRESSTVDSPALQFITDECHLYDDAGLQAAAKRFRKRKIKPVMSTQAPPSVDPRARDVNEWQIWLSPPPQPMHNWIRTQSMFPLELLVELGQYEALVMDDQHEPIARVRAPARFARE